MCVCHKITHNVILIPSPAGKVSQTIDIFQAEIPYKFRFIQKLYKVEGSLMIVLETAGKAPRYLVRRVMTQRVNRIVWK